MRHHMEVTCPHCDGGGRIGVECEFDGHEAWPTSADPCDQCGSELDTDHAVIENAVADLDISDLNHLARDEWECARGEWERENR